MKTSTIQDIEVNLETLQAFALELADQALAEKQDDIWHSYKIKNMYFDLNVYLSVNEQEQETITATVYPVIMESAKYGVTDTLNYKRLIEKIINPTTTTTKEKEQ